MPSAFPYSRQPNEIPWPGSDPNHRHKNPANEELVSSGSIADLIPGLPPIVIILVCLTLAFTAFFAWAIYFVQRDDAEGKHRNPAHPAWRGRGGFGAQRSPKKKGSGFAMRGFAGGERRDRLGEAIELEDVPKKAKNDWGFEGV